MTQVECPVDDCDGTIRPAGGVSSITPPQIMKLILEENQTVKIVPLECTDCDWSERKTLMIRDPSLRNT